MVIKHIGVVGAGKMGHGIALSAAMAGYDVVLDDQNPAALSQAVEKIGSELERLVKKQTITVDESGAAWAKIEETSTFGGFDGLDLVVEAITESLDLKKKLLAQLDKVCREDAILVSTTSTFSITSLAAATKRPAQFAGMHFFIPPAKLVEVTRGYYTSDITVDQVRAVAHRMGKVVVEVRRDSPGFIANRIYTPLLYEAFRVYEEGLATKEEIDLAMKSSYLPVGPFELADVIGLDVLMSGFEYFHGEFGPAWNPPQSLKQLVRAGRLGRKTNKGWYDY